MPRKNRRKSVDATDAVSFIVTTKSFRFNDITFIYTPPTCWIFYCLYHAHALQIQWVASEIMKMYTVAPKWSLILQLYITSISVDRFFTTRRYASAVYAVVVCPCDRLSVTHRYCTKMAKPRITQTTYTLVFGCRRSRQNSNRFTPTVAPNRGGVG